MMKFKEFLAEKIIKAGKKWKVMSSSGDQLLGTHESRKKALAQLAAVEISKKKRKK